MSIDPDPIHKQQYIAAQIAVENQWIIQRTGWNLTVQGLMFAAIGVADKVDGKPQLLALVHEMPVAGIALCCLTLVGVIGANLQINRLISAWEEAQPAHGVPPPFGDRAARRLGAFPSWSIPVVLAALWLKVALS